MIHIYPLLFSPLFLKTITLKNRIVMSPAGTNFATSQGQVTQRLLDHYEARAGGGVGLIIIERTSIHASGRTIFDQLGADDDNLVPGLESLSEAIGTHGAARILQLHHGGREANPNISGMQPFAP